MILLAIKKIQGFKRFLMELGVPVWVVPTNCKFHPSCSEYLIEAIEKQGLIKGCSKGLWRITRCNPWNRGGFDPV